MTQSHVGVAGIRGAQIPRDLARAPPLGEQVADGVVELLVGLDPSLVITGPFHDRVAVSPMRLVAAAPDTVAAQFPRHSRRRRPDPDRDLPDRMTGMPRVSDLDTLVLGQVPGTDLPY
ncbi:MAG: hypothetical protein WC054_08695 [Candidatus Nanopelagicales bacterium]